MAAVTSKSFRSQGIMFEPSILCLPNAINQVEKITRRFDVFGFNLYFGWRHNLSYKALEIPEIISLKHNNYNYIIYNYQRLTESILMKEHCVSGKPDI